MPRFGLSLLMLCEYKTEIVVEDQGYGASLVVLYTYGRNSLPNTCITKPSETYMGSQHQTVTWLCLDFLKLMFNSALPYIVHRFSLFVRAVLYVTK